MSTTGSLKYGNEVIELPFWRITLLDEKELVGVCGAGHGNEHCEFRASSLKRSCEIFRFFYKMYGVEILNS